MTKTELRQLYKVKRKALSHLDIQMMSLRIFKNFDTTFDLRGKSISIFLPIEKFNEIDTWAFINEYPANYYLPVVGSENNLSHVKFESRTQLQKTNWGILEPQFGEKGLPYDFDAVLIPLLAYDIEGNRVGYGKGFYDGFLKDCRPDCIFIGLSYFEPEQNIIETFESDIRLHYCITPDKVFNFKTS